MGQLAGPAPGFLSVTGEKGGAKAAVGGALHGSALVPYSTDRNIQRHPWTNSGTVWRERWSPDIDSSHPSAFLPPGRPFSQDSEADPLKGMPWTSQAASTGLNATERQDCPTPLPSPLLPSTGTEMTPALPAGAPPVTVDVCRQSLTELVLTISLPPCVGHLSATDVFL